MPLGKINVQQISFIYKVLDLKINSHFVIEWHTELQGVSCKDSSPFYLGPVALCSHGREVG